jgi:DNA polymerase/3'-5' exonuclease PolX
MNPQPPFNFTSLTRVDINNDAQIVEKLKSCSCPNNARVVLALFAEANGLFSANNRADTIRGAAYLKAADTMILQRTDIRSLTKSQLMGLDRIGEKIAARIVEIAANLY